MPGRGDSERVLILAPLGRDADLTLDVLAKHGIDGLACRDPDALCAAIAEGAGCAILTEEAIDAGARERLARTLEGQPPWSDLPLIVFGAPARRTGGRDVLPALGNVTVLDRPAKTRTLVSAVRTALRARRRQYDAKRAIEQRDQFLAMLGHELRNPLHAIVLATDLLSGPEERLARQRDILQRQAAHLARLVDDLLDVSRVTSGKVALRRQRLDLEQVLRRALESTATMTRARAIELELAPLAEPLSIDGDPVRLEQVFSNLLTNAVKYSPPGTRVSVAARRSEDRAAIHVRDAGVGIPAHMLRTVFDLFTQVESSLDRAQGGMGIGLTLVRSLVVLHGGTVEARSEGLGKGAEFVVHLPLAAAEAPRAVAASAPGQQAGCAVRVVLVEDSDDVREMSRDALELLGCQVEVASDGPSGLRRILGSRPDVALIDVGLPGLDGYTLGRQVRDSLGDRIVLVALTGYGLPEDQQRARAAGFDLHLTKPVTIPMLAEAVARGASKADA